MQSREGSLELSKRQDGGVVLIGLVAGLGTAFLLATAARRSHVPRTPVRMPPAAPSRALSAPVNVAAARGLNRASAILAASVLADSGLQHYRGMFANRAMYTPIAVGGLMLAMSLYASADRQARAHGARGALQAVAGLTGIVGTGFHLYNLGKREGGLSWSNLFYAAPVGAPFALTLSGALGVAAELVRAAGAEPPRFAGLPAGRALAAFAAFGLAGTIGEAGLYHFRGAFQNPAMLVPVTLPPLAAALLAGTALSGSATPPPLVRWTLRATALAGVAGVAFHAYGVSRMMGGWYNWSQNLINGPPLPAPPAFTGLALAGLAALDLVGAEHG